jgi:hypothetical protein
MAINRLIPLNLSILSLMLAFFSLVNLYGILGNAAANLIYPESFGAKADGVTDSTEAIRQAITASAQISGPSEIVFSSGVYRVNCTTPINGVCFSLNKSIDLTLRGQSSNTTFLIANPFAGFVRVMASKNIILSGFQIDYAKLPFTQGKITKLINRSTTERFLELTIEQGYPQLKDPLFSPEHLPRTFGMLFQPSSPSLKGRPGAFYPVESIAQIGTSQYQLKVQHLTDMTVGDQFALPNRSQTSLHFQNTSNITLRQVTLFTGPGPASIWVNNNGKINIDGFQVRRKPGSTRLLSTAADAIHMRDNRALLTIQNCFIEGMGDDPINLRSNFFTFSNEFTASKFNVKAAVTDFQTGDTIQVINPDNKSARGTAKIKEVFYSNGISTLILESPVTNVQATDLIFSANLGSEFAVIRNNTFSNFRGIFRIRSQGAIFANNQFLDPRNAKVYIAADLTSQWKEGPSLVNSLNGVYFIDNTVKNGTIRILGTGYADLGEPTLSGRAALLTHPLLFSTTIYRRLHRDLAGMNDSQLKSHFVNYGISEGRQGGLNFSVLEYLKLHSDLRGMTYLQAANHYIINGAITEGRAGSVTTHRLVYNPALYRSYNADLQPMGSSDLGLHWLLNGIYDGRRASHDFYSRNYLNRYPDLQRSLGATNYRGALEHFVLQGYKEGRIGN